MDVTGAIRDMPTTNPDNDSTGIHMVKRSVGYAYQWDYIGDPAAASRAATLGLDAVAVAASYHSTRAATPLHPIVASSSLRMPHATCRSGKRHGGAIVSSPPFRAGIRTATRSATLTVK